MTNPSTKDKLKHPGGRPPLYKSPEEMQIAIDAYFESCFDEDGKRIKPFTVCGLANSIGMTRETLLRYREKDGFSDTIKKAREKVHQFVEEYLFQGKNTAGAIFNLKNNFAWVDKQEHEHTGKIEGVNIIFKSADNAD